MNECFISLPVVTVTNFSHDPIHAAETQVYTTNTCTATHARETSQTWLISSGCCRMLAALVLGHPTLELWPEVTDEALNGGSSSGRSGTSKQPKWPLPPIVVQC